MRIKISCRLKMERSENYIKFNYKVKFYTKCFLQEVLKTLNHFCLQDIFYLLRSYFYHLAKLYSVSYTHLAGINAARFVQGKEGIVIDRSQGYIGVLIDDLVTKESHEPYRMMTSRAEYRLLLRQDNADLRLSKLGYEIGLVPKERYDYICRKEELIEEEINRLENYKIGAAKENQDILADLGSSSLKDVYKRQSYIIVRKLSYDF